MARTFPVLPEPFGFDPALSILETLGVDDPAATVPADGLGLAEVIVSAAPAQPGFDAGDSSAAVAAVFGTDLPEESAGAGDPMAGLIRFDFDSISEAEPSSPAMQAATEAITHVVVDFASDAADVSAAAASDSLPFDVAAEANGGQPVPGGGGGGGAEAGVLTEWRSGSDNGDAGYDIWIQFKGRGWTTDLQDAFIDAADYFTTVITKDIGGGGRIQKVIVDDLYVTAEVKAIDGVGGVLGQAGPNYVWTASDLTASGKMQFDVADASSYFDKGLWNDIVTHELMHVLGFGSLWEYGRHDLTTDNQYTGTNAVTVYGKTIPVETDGGSGTAGSHWDDATLGNELMTGYINPSNYLSKFSVMSLADLGYAVTNYYDYLV